MSVKAISVPTKILSQSITAAASTFRLNDIEGWDGVNLTSASFGTQAYGVFRNAARTQVELFEFDPTTIASADITILRRGLKYDGDLTTEVSGNKYAWTKGDTYVDIGTDTPQIFQYLLENVAATDVNIASIINAATSKNPPVGADNFPIYDSVGLVLKKLSFTNLLSYLANTFLSLSGGTLTGANTVVGTTTNIIKLQFNDVAATQVNGAGLWAANTTAATVGVQKWSPSTVLEGQGWATGVNNSQSVKVAQYVIPVQAATNPTATHVLSAISIDGGAYTNALTFSAFTANTYTLGGSYLYYIDLGVNGSIGPVSNGGMNLRTNNTTRQSISNLGNTAHTGTAATSGSFQFAKWTSPANTNQTASTEQNTIQFNYFRKHILSDYENI